MNGSARHVGSSTSGDNGLDAGGGIKSVAVSWARKRAHISFVTTRASAKVVAGGIGVACISAVESLRACTLPIICMSTRVPLGTRSKLTRRCSQPRAQHRHGC